MRPLGRTYFVEADKSREQVLEGGIIVPREDEGSLAHYTGVVREIGLGFDETKDNELVPGDRIIFDWKRKEGKAKLAVGDMLYYVLEEDLVLAKTEDGE